MRAAALLLLLALLAGCVTPPEAPPATNATSPTAPSPETPAPTAPPAMGERAPPVNEHFVLLANRSLGVHRPGDAPMEVAHVQETSSPLAFYTSVTQVPALEPWLSFPFATAWESTADIELALALRASAPSASASPRQSGFAPIGCWLGTEDRFALFAMAHDAPDTLAAGEERVVRLSFASPPGGLFVNAGERLALRCFSQYQGADGSSVQWIVGGPQPAGFALPHRHFELHAPRAVPLIEERGELAPNPAPTGAQQHEPALLPFQVPADALYVVVHVEGAAKAGGRADVDVSILTPAGERLAGGSGPGASEAAAIGPGALAVAGRDLVARVTGATNAAGATFTLTVTAYAP